MQGILVDNDNISHQPLLLHFLFLLLLHLMMVSSRQHTLREKYWNYKKSGYWIQHILVY